MENHSQNIKKTIGWKAPSNIALVKYWGKRALQLPENGSISLSLDQTGTTTCLTYNKRSASDGKLSLSYSFHRERKVNFEAKVANYLSSLLPEMPWLCSYDLKFNSENNFPHSSGIASSAASMAALALCLVSLEEEEKGQFPDRTAFYRRASYLARLGSGSASRSVYGGLVSWGAIPFLPDSSNLYASPITLSGESRLMGLCDAVLIVSSQEKPVSSSAGHALMASHPYREGRIAQANQHLQLLLEAITRQEHSIIAEITEIEALSLHALLMTSTSEGMLMLPNTISIIQEIKNFRKNTGLDLFFTLDAGPNIHLIYFEDQRRQVLSFLENSLVQYCEEGNWIDDKMGSGPIFINPTTQICDEFSS